MRGVRAEPLPELPALPSRTGVPPLLACPACTCGAGTGGGQARAARLHLRKCRRTVAG